MDFFTVPTLTYGVLYCFFVISHDRRKILHFFNVTRNPTAVWIVRRCIRGMFARQVVDDLAPGRQPAVVERFLAFARAYLSTAFPIRTDTDARVKRYYDHKPRIQLVLIRQSLTNIGLCSRCFKQYMRLLAELSSNRTVWNNTIKSSQA